MADDDSIVTPILEAVSKSIADKMGPLGTSAAQMFFDHFKSSLGGFTAGSSPSAPGAGANAAAPTTSPPTTTERVEKTKVEVDSSGFAALEKTLSGSSAGLKGFYDKMTGMVGNTDGLTKGFEHLTAQVTKSDFLMAVGIQATANKVLEARKKVLEFASTVEKPLKFDKSALDAFGGFSQEFGQTSKVVTQFRTELENAGKMGFSTERSVAELKQLSSATGLSIGAIASLGTSLTRAGDAVPAGAFTGFAGLERMIAATGIEGAKAMDLMRMQMKAFNTESGEALNVIAELDSIIQNTSVSMDEAATVVSSNAQKFTMLGGNIKGVELVYKQFLDGLKPGQEAIAGILTDKTLGSLAGLNTEMKAFIGMTSNLGQGGGSLESALRVEEALASGEGLQEVMDGIFAQAEKISGTPLLTRKEALETGQAQQYYTQKATVNQMLGGNYSDVELEKMFEARQGGGGTTLRSVQGASPAALLERSERNLDIEIGPLTRQIEKISSAIEIKGSNQASEKLRELGVATNEVTDNLSKFSERLGETFNAVMSSMKGKTSYTDMEKIGSNWVEGGAKMPTGKDAREGAPVAAADSALVKRKAGLKPVGESLLERLSPVDEGVPLMTNTALPDLNLKLPPLSGRPNLLPQLSFDNNSAGGQNNSTKAENIVNEVMDKLELRLGSIPVKFKVALDGDNQIRLTIPNTSASAPEQ